MQNRLDELSTFLQLANITQKFDVKKMIAQLNFVTEMHFSLAATIQAGQLRGAGMIDTAVAQLVRRGWSNTGAKKQIQTKVEYKKMNQGRSPDDSDVLIGAHEIAVRMGFRSNIKRTVSSAGSNLSPLTMIENLGTLAICMKKKAKPLVLSA